MTKVILELDAIDTPYEFGSVVLKVMAFAPVGPFVFT